MKAILFAATTLTLVMPMSVPLHAATLTPAFSLEMLMNGEMDRHGRGCDTAHDIAQNPRCTRA